MAESDSLGSISSGSAQSARGSAIAQASGGATATVTANVVNNIEFPPELIPQLLDALSGRELLQTGSLDFPRAMVSGEPPVTPAHPIARKTLADDIAKSLSARRPVLLRGEFGSGRSELARATTASSSNLLWLDLQANVSLAPSAAIEQVLLNAVPRAISKELHDFAEIIANLPPDTALVIDNIDSVISDSNLSARLSSLARNAAGSSVTLICTSIHKLPHQFNGLFDDIQVGRYSGEDINELFQAHNAPASINTASFRNSVLLLTQGEPALATVMMQYLRQRQWQLDEKAWDDLLRGTFAADLKAETQRRLLGAETKTTCELLYRLSLLNRAFTEQEALKIARIDPEIPNPLQELHLSYGTWLQKSDDSHWRTSALLSGLGDGNLIKPIRKQVHLMVVDWVIAPKKVDQFGVCEAVTHLIEAEEFNHAAQVLIQALFSLKEAGPGVEPGPMLSLWRDLPLPHQMDLGLRILLRGLQASVLIQRGESYEFAINDLRSLMRSPKTSFEFIGTFAACSLVAMQLLEKRPVDALPYISLATRRQFEITKRQIMKDLPEHSIVEMFWGAAMHINDAEGLQKWITEVDHLSTEQKTALFNAPFGADCACRVFDVVWMREQDLPEESRDWNRLLSLLNSCQSTISRWNSSLLMGCVIRSQQAIRIVHIRTVEAAIEEATTFFAKFQGVEHATGRFLVAQGTGLWLTNIDRWDLAAAWLERASEYNGDDLIFHRHQNYLRYGHSLYREGTPNIEPFELAVLLGTESKYLTPLNRVKARAELATFLWLTGNKQELFDQWSTVVRELLDSRQDTRWWKETYVLVGNNTSYWSNRVKGRTDGAASMVVKPYLGMFINDYVDFSDHYSDGILFTLPGMMSWFAESVERFNDAADWAKIAVTVAETVSANPSGASFLFQAVPSALIGAQYDEAVSQSAQATRALALNIPLNAPEAVRKNNPYLNQSRPISVEPTQTECHAIQLGVLPSLVAIIAGSFAQSEIAAAQLDGLVTACDRQDAISTAKGIWPQAADCLMRIKDGSLRYADIADSAAADAGPTSHMVFLLLSFGLMAVRETPANEVLLAQIRWSSWISKVYAGFRGIGMVLARSIAKSWQEYVLTHSFSFRQPRYAARMIAEAGKKGEIGRIYTEVVDSLGFVLTEDYRRSLLSAKITLDDHLTNPSDPQ